MTKLIILRGNSGSGKTTAAKALQERIGPNTMLISLDMIRMQMLHVWGREGIEKARPLLIELVKYGSQHSEITILEGILDSQEYHLLFEACAEAFGSRIFAYYTICRLRKRCGGTAPSPIATNLVKRICAAGGVRRII